jgi:glycosyltransferase involved in cell wall biosynthesis
VGWPEEQAAVDALPRNVNIEIRSFYQGPARVYERVKTEYGAVRSLAADRDAVLLSPLNFAVFGPKRQVLMARNAKLFDWRALPPLASREQARLLVQRKLALASLRAVSHVVVPSRMMAELVRPFAAESSVTVLPHAIDVGRAVAWSTKPVPEVAQAWATNTGPRLLYVGSTAAQKNIPMLIDIVEELSRSYGTRASLAVTFAADAVGREAATFRRKMKNRALDDAVHFLGPVGLEDVFPLYRSADVVLFTSVVESFGLPVLEALALGKRVVASDIAAFREVGGELIEYHPVSDARQAASRVTDVLSQAPPSLDKLRSHLARFRWDLYAERMTSILDRA